MNGEKKSCCTVVEDMDKTYLLNDQFSINLLLRKCLENDSATESLFLVKYPSFHHCLAESPLFCSPVCIRADGPL